MKNNHIKNLYLHAGLSKTGTSSIQDTLFANRELLLRNDYFYSSKLPRNHSDIFRNLFSDLPETHHTNVKHGANAEKIRAINLKNTETICQEISETNCSNVVYSAESISILADHELKRMNAFFRDLVPSAKLHIIVSTRDPIDYINSAVQQQKRTAIGKNLSFCFEFKFQRLIDGFGRENIVAYKFEDACEHELGPVGHFLNVVGLSNKQLADIKLVDSNSSLSNTAVDIIDFTNSKVPMFSEDRISGSRIHLDYAHFHGLSGNKFQLGKEYYDANVCLLELAESCQWLKDNMGIGYTVKEIPDKPPQIKYGSIFSDEIKAIYPYLTPVLKKVTHDYVRDRSQAPNVDTASRETLSRLLDWLVSNNQNIERDSLDRIIKSQSAMVSNDKRHRLQLLKRFKGDDIRAGHFLRDVALFLEHYDMLDQSLYFMNKAKMYSPTVELIDDKLEEYKSILEHRD